MKVSHRGRGLAVIVTVLMVAVTPAPSLARESPYNSLGSIAAFAADGTAIDVSYYDRIGDGPLPQIVGDSFGRSVRYPGPADGPSVSSVFIDVDPSCAPFEPYPWRTFPQPQDQCWAQAFDANASTPGTYGVIVPLTVEVAGTTQVFDEWAVQDALVEGFCKTGDMGVAVTRNQSEEPSHRFARGAEYRVFTDLADGLGFGADIAARYANVSPDVSAPLFLLDHAVECASVERGDPLDATFSCEEPGGLGTGVATCRLTDRQGEVASGQSLDTSVLGTHPFTVTTTDAAGNTRTRSGTYTVVEGTTTLPDASVDENAPIGTAVGTFQTSNADPDETWTYELVPGEGADDNASFTITGSTLLTDEVLDAESRSSYSIRVRATDVAAGVSTQTPLTVTVRDVSDLTAVPQTVPESSPVGTVVGVLSNVPPGNSGALHDYALVAGEGDDDNAAFTVARTQYGSDTPPGEIWELRTNQSLDFETRSVYRIRLRKTFDVSAISPQENMLTIRVVDANDAPATTADVYSTGEDVVLEVPPADGVLANDSDQDDDVLTAELVSGPVNGALALDPDGGFSYTPDAGFSGTDAFSYRATDGTAFSGETAVTITVRARPALTFTDVPEGSIFSAEISDLVRRGITQGFPDGTYRPGSPVQRDQMAAFLYRLAGRPSFDVPSTATFVDVPVGSTFFVDVEWLAAQGVTRGVQQQDGSVVFAPGGLVDRGQLAAFLYRLSGQPDYPAEGISFTDVAPGQVFAREIGWLAFTGVTVGFPAADGTREFRPAVIVDRGQMAAFLSRFADLEQ